MGLFSKFKKEEKVYNDTDIIALADAKIVPTAEIKDAVFAQEMLGQTIAFHLYNDVIVAPCNGTLEVMFPTGHAFAIRRTDGMGILVHIGIDTVKLKGKYFKTFAKQGDQVKAGQKLVKVDREMVKEAGFDVTTMLIITEPANEGERVNFTCQGTVEKGQILNS